ncbi:hypothetical protein BDV95DRAFT_542071 [Massariosphaeria phaeospora]|uniref:Mitochondrial pyruvate carrier n=1 Tax=Massariosphaeria phaeospora TaxID=100035 RepID=A0A7C8I8C1_9PLEO|nr:hypothetical protein BDV95DRAFT_542071 [Massariosphaeria phaeospora]
MSFRPGARISSAFRPLFRQPLLRRRVQTAAGPAEAPSGFAKFWQSPVGPKTVHFWAPIMKWGVVLTGVSDFARPAEQLSLTQNAALLCTGAIWTRWCFIIRPKNMFLAAVNFFLFLVGSAQCTRIVLWRRSVKDTEAQAEGEVKDLKDDLMTTEIKAEKVVKR